MKGIHHKKREAYDHFLPKGKYGRVAMKWELLFHNETIMNNNGMAC